MSCALRGVEVMGRDVSVISTNQAALAPTVRAIISTDHMAKIGGTSVRFTLLPHKVFLFDQNTGERLRFQAEAVGR